MKTLKINDKVMVISGDYKGETAKIVHIDRENRKAMLEGIGERERHMRRTQYSPAGKKTIHVGIDFSNLKLVEAAKYEKPAKKDKSGQKGAK
jgi:ribosomal protein L24